MTYETKNFNKSDWKLFREKVPLWQENYMNNQQFLFKIF